MRGGAAARRVRRTTHAAWDFKRIGATWFNQPISYSGGGSPGARGLTLLLSGSRPL